MDTEILVDNRIDDGRELISELARDGFDVTVAFWVKTSEKGRWFLYIGSTSVDAETIGVAYGAVNACLVRLLDPPFSLSEIKLVQVDNPIAREAIAVRDRVSTRIPIRYRGERLGNIFIDEAYIYPRVGSMTPNEIAQTVLGLMKRTGAVQPSVVKMRDGSSFRAIPRGIQGGVPGEMQIVLLDVVNNEDRTVSLTDVVEIQ